MIYTQRKEVLAGENIEETMVAILDETVEDMVATFCPDKTPANEWKLESLQNDFLDQFNFPAELPAVGPGFKPEGMVEALASQVHRRLEARTEEFTPSVMRHLMKVLLLQTRNNFV